MKIAVTYDNGSVFPHFGKTEAFKVYEVEEGRVLAAQVIGTEGNGHEALAGFLADKGISVLLCGGMGAGAQAALSEAGIEVYSGVEGDADAAVATYLQGNLTSAGVNCDHHDHEETEESSAEEENEEGCEGGCEGGCGGCGSAGGCGGCGGCHPQIVLEGPNAGKICKVHYIGTLDDGSQFDSSYDRGEPLEFVCGAGMMIAGFDKAVVDMQVGEKKQIHLMPEEAYGERNPNAVISASLEQLKGAENLSVGQKVYLQNIYGQPFQAQVIAKDDTTITFDANHELAGKELNFLIELVSVS